MEEAVTNEEVQERESRCSLCEHLAQADGYCYKHCCNCWEVIDCCAE